MRGHVVPRFVYVQRVVLRCPFLRPDRQKREQGDRNEGHNRSAHRHLLIVLTLNETASFCNRRKVARHYGRNGTSTAHVGTAALGCPTKRYSADLSASVAGADFLPHHSAAKTSVAASSPERMQSGTPIPR